MNLQEIDEIIDRVKRLSGVIRDMQDRIENSRSSFQNSETATRYQLIDPVLDELGWDVRNNKLVVPEYTVSGGRVDYALMHDGSPIAVVEAKSLSRTLDDSVTVQVLSYITDESTIKYAIATNGDSWQMRVKGERSKSVDIRIAGSSGYETALEMMRISRVVLQPDEENPVLPPIVGPCPTPEVPGPEVDWIPLTKADPRPKGLSPKSVRFEDGRETKLDSNQDLLFKVANWLANTTTIEEWSKLDDPHVHTSASDARVPRVLDNGRYIDFASISKWKYILNKSKKFLAHFGYEASKVYVKFG